VGAQTRSSAGPPDCNEILLTHPTPAAALALVDELDLDNYHPFHATRADLLRRLGRISEAAAAYQRAAAMAPTDAERDFLKLGGRGSR
jgi:RNA polymerase sigma-70 factor, ECF subfamily